MINPYFDDGGGRVIYHGDCREILPTLPKFDLCLTDPPYGIGENAHRIASRGKLAATTDYGDFDWDSEPASDEEISMTMASARKVIIWGGNYFKVPPSRGWLVWDKLNSGNFADCELAYTNLDMSVRIYRFMWNGMIRDGENRGKPRVHPTQKPVELMQWCLGWMRSAETVIDAFMGSGPVLQAAKNLNLKCVGIELEEKYCEIAARRLQQEVLDFNRN